MYVDVPEYNQERGLHAVWDRGFSIRSRVEDGEVVVVANTAGLVSLARHLLALAQPEVPDGSHWHFDDTNSLEDGSTGLIIQKSSAPDEP